MTPSAKRRARRRRAVADTQQQAADYQAAAKFISAISGFDGANSSTRRGWIYWPTLDTRRELDSYSRTELLRKARALRANTGLPNRIVSGLSDMIGYLTPLSASGDDAWDDLCDRHWADRAGEAMVIDAAGRFNIRELQLELNKAAFGDGDVLPVLIRGGTDGVMVAAYEAHQVMSPEDEFADATWVDGVKINKFGRHLGYGLKDSAKWSYIPARDAIYYCHPRNLGQVRPPTILCHAINHMQDVSEILADVKLTIKVAAQLGLYLKSSAANNSGGFAGARAIGGNLRNELANEGDGTPEDPESKYKVEDFFRSMGGVANLPGGMDVGVIQDSRPHPNQLALLEHLVRDIAWGVGVAPEIIWNIEKLRGANNRLVNADLNRWIGCRLLRLQSWLKRFRAVWVSAEIDAGRLPPPRGAGMFWRAAFLPQANLTADKGREGQLDMELVLNGLKSMSSYFANDGKDWQTEFKQIAREKNFLEKLGLDVGQVFKAKSADFNMLKSDPNETDPDNADPFDTEDPESQPI